jgi:hypothetical protein
MVSSEDSESTAALVPEITRLRRFIAYPFVVFGANTEKVWHFGATKIDSSVSETGIQYDYPGTNLRAALDGFASFPYAGITALGLVSLCRPLLG